MLIIWELKMLSGMKIVYLGAYLDLFLEMKNLYPLVRQEIHEEAVRGRNNYPDITLYCKIGPLHIGQYIDHIKNNQFYWGEL